MQVFVYYIPPPITFYFLFLYYFIYCNRFFYSHLAFPAPDEDKFCLVEHLVNKFVNLSCPISLAFSFKSYFILLILIFSNIRLFLAAVCPSGPCKNCSLINPLIPGLKLVRLPLEIQTFLPVHNIST